MSRGFRFDAIVLRRLVIGLAIAAFLLAKPGQTIPLAAFGIAAILGTTLLIYLGKAGWPFMAGLVGLGVALRLIRFRGLESDALSVTVTAIHQALAGSSPYAVGPPGSLLAGSTFPYGPVSLLWDLPVQFEPRVMELVASFAVLVALAVWRRPLGLAVYAAVPLMVLQTTDGSNDTSAGLLILLALVVAERRPLCGGVLLAIATGCKPYAAAWAVPLIAWGGLMPLVGFAATSVVVWSPLLIWGPRSFLDALQRAESIHTAPYYSLAEYLERYFGVSLAENVFGPLRLALGFGTAVIVGARLVFVKSYDVVVVGGSLVFVVLMYAGFWATPAYLAAIAPILCWKLDGWIARPAPMAG